MNLHGCSTCNKGQEKFQKFTSRGKSYIQYDYRTEGGQLFSTVANSLEKARDQKNKWLNER